MGRWWFRPPIVSLRAAIAGGKIDEVKRYIGNDGWSDKTHKWLAAMQGDQCPVCFEDVAEIEPQNFDVGANCFHFICTPCKQKYASAGRSNRNDCVVCRQ